MTIPGSKRESVTNFEVDKTVRVTRNSTGGIKRMTAAVVVNYLPVAAAEGEGAAAPKALPAEQQAQMLALVRETIGYNADRGDSVNLMNAPFRVEKVNVENLPLWRQPETIELAKTLAWPVGLGVAAAVVLLGLLLRRRKQKKQEATAVDLLAAEELERPALAAPLKPGEPSPEQIRLEQARALAKQNPIAVANIVKTWISGEAS